MTYVLRENESSEALAKRIYHSGEHLASIGFSPEPTLQVQDENSGMVAWSYSTGASHGAYVVHQPDGALAYLHQSSSAVHPVGSTDKSELAAGVLSGTVDIGSLTPPFAVLRWMRGRIDIANDMLGLVRLFHFSFPGAEVWTTRAGLAHVFMGIAPRMNQSAWAGMATVGWAPNGVTQLGEGRQVPGGARIRAQRDAAGRVIIESDSVFPDWFTRNRAMPLPTPAQMVEDMREAMRSATVWPQEPVADLSGGRDSRLIAAVGISGGTVKTVRTVRTDYGEVETAQQLVAAVAGAVDHMIVDPVTTGPAPGSVRERLFTHHMAWEGRYLASAGVLSRSFRGFRPRVSAVFNGLGGEVLAGGALWPGAWRERLASSPATAAVDRISAMANAQEGTTEGAREETVAQLRRYVPKAESLGVPTGGAVMDLLYAGDRMPNWVNTFTGTDVLVPLFAPSLLIQAVHSVGHPIPDGALHESLIAGAIPQWRGIPFYKPVGHSRIARPRVWEYDSWPEASRAFEEGVGKSTQFTGQAVDFVRRQIFDSKAAKTAETVIYRVLWESTFSDYVESVKDAAEKCARDVASASGEPSVTPPH